MTEPDFETYATLRTTAEKFRKMIDQSALDGDVAHSDLYLNILEDEVEVLQSAPGEVVLTYCSFRDSYFDELTLHKDTEEITEQGKGEEISYEVGAEAIVNVEDTKKYLGYASESGKIELEFQGEDSNKRLSQRLAFDGALNSWIRLPGSQDILEDVPQWLPFRFNGEEVYTNTKGDAAPTQITVGTQKLRKITEIVQGDTNAEFYPIVVEDGEFRVSIGELTDSGVRGSFSTKNTQGPDVENYYFDGFDEIFSVLSGEVQLQTAPGNNPMAVVQQGSSGQVIRQINGPVNK